MSNRTLKTSPPSLRETYARRSTAPWGMVGTYLAAPAFEAFVILGLPVVSASLTDSTKQASSQIGSSIAEGLSGREIASLSVRVEPEIVVSGRNLRRLLVSSRDFGHRGL